MAATLSPLLAPSAHKTRFYRPELDVLRFWAFLMVFCHHAPYIWPRGLESLGRAGGGGMCVFFTLSAYLIGELLLREEEATGTIHLRKFYLRRVLRIWPLYFVMVLGGAIFGHFHPAYAVPPKALAAFFLFTGNLYIAHVGYFNSFIYILWSISLEEQFYLIVPSVWRSFGKRGMIVLAVLTFPVAYLSLAWLTMHQPDDRHIWYSSLVQFQFFGLGLLLAVAFGKRTVKFSDRARALLLCVAASCFLGAEAVFHYKEPSTVAPGLGGYLCLALACGTLLIAVLNWRPLANLKWAIYLGKISFGLYVFHTMTYMIVDSLLKSHKIGLVTLPHGYYLLGALEFGSVLLLTIALASLSYRFLETPFLLLKERFAIVRSRPVSLGA